MTHENLVDRRRPARTATLMVLLIVLIWSTMCNRAKGGRTNCRSERQNNRQRIDKAQIFFPPVAGLDWARILADPHVPIVFTNDPLKALKFCLQEQPAIAVMGMSESVVRQWLRSRGANVIVRPKNVQ